ncbi:DNA-binding transcriptional response regulator [Dawidia soli]|uniref:Uncharacterized protein n=1 Tax=Dawidia soli TaxID=2782352 RepID=A0AAP2DDP5_9BACT|nr:hypothetical protein [Dawidia soli]MBT1689432.1 hypothetical protein [Dawidia soli]
MIKILLSDDNEAFRTSSREIGAALDCDLNCYDDWESAQVELDTNFNTYHAVVIDGKGRLRDSSKGEDPRHLLEAVIWLREQRAKGRFVPVVVYTGFHPDIEPVTTLNDQILKVFDKSKTKFEDVLKFLKTEASKLPSERLKNSYPAVFNFSAKYFNKEKHELLIELLDGLNNGLHDFVRKKTTLDALRLLNEALVDTIPLHYYSAPFELRTYIEKINRENPPKRPANMGNRTVAIVDFFVVDFKAKTHTEFPSYLVNTIKNIYYTASTYASHNPETVGADYPSSEMILGLVYSHFGCYHWFNSIITD